MSSYAELQQQVTKLHHLLDGTQKTVNHLRDAGIPTLLFCPYCGQQHVDAGEWATKPHRTHLCLHCHKTWRPYEVATYGMAYTLAPKKGSDLCTKCGGRRQSMDRELQLDQCGCDVFGEP